MIFRLISICFFLMACFPAFAQKAPYSPKAGSPERKAIFDAMRKRGDRPTREFIVRALKVQNGWAWASTNPQMPGGKEKFEPESVLLHKKNGQWRVVDQLCGEETCDASKELARIRHAFPTAPAGIFP